MEGDVPNRGSRYETFFVRKADLPVTFQVSGIAGAKVDLRISGGRLQAQYAALNGATIQVYHVTGAQGPKGDKGAGVPDGGTDGQVLTKTSSADGAVAWETPAAGGGTGDITSVVAGAGLTGGATSGTATVNVGAGTGITVNANNISLADERYTSAEKQKLGNAVTGSSITALWAGTKTAYDALSSKSNTTIYFTTGN